MLKKGLSPTVAFIILTLFTVIGGTVTYLYMNSISKTTQSFMQTNIKKITYTYGTRIKFIRSLYEVDPCLVLGMNFERWDFTCDDTMCNVTFKDISNYHNDGVFYGNLKGEYRGYIEYFNADDGSFEYIRLPSDWFEGKDYIKIEFIGLVDEKGDADSLYGDWLIAMNDGIIDNYFSIAIKNSSGELVFTGYNISSISTGIKIDDWVNRTHNIVAEFNFTEHKWRLWVDGKYIGEGTTLISQLVSNIPCVIFGQELDSTTTCDIFDPKQAFKGKIKEIRVYDKNGLVGVVYNYPKWIKGKYGYALEFDGVDDYVKIPSTIKLNKSGRRTVIFWFKFYRLPPHRGSDDYNVLFEDECGGLTMRLYDDGKIVIKNKRIWQTHISNITLSGKENTWIFLAHVYDNLTSKLYINGKLDSSFLFSDLINSTRTKIIGIGSSSYFNGIIDELFIYNRALSDEEIKACYQDIKNCPRDDSLVLHLSFDEGKGKYVNDLSFIKKGPWGCYVKFDGIDDYIKIEPFTFYGWKEITYADRVIIPSSKPNSAWSKSGMYGDYWVDHPSFFYAYPNKATGYTSISYYWAVRKPDGSIANYGLGISKFDQWLLTVWVYKNETRTLNIATWDNKGLYRQKLSMIPTDYYTIVDWDPKKATNPDRYNKIIFGCNVVGEECVNDSHDEIYFFKRALSSKEIELLYKNYSIYYPIRLMISNTGETAIDLKDILIFVKDKNTGEVLCSGKLGYEFETPENDTILYPGKLIDFVIYPRKDCFDKIFGRELEFELCLPNGVCEKEIE